jgi:HAD superfamily phosphatase (TIGR01668 family)
MLKEFIKNILKPGEYVDNIFSINYDSLKKQGVKALLFDLDNTILPGNEYLPSIRVINLFTDLKLKGFKLALLSNAFKNERVKKIAESLNVDAYYFVCKPFTPILKIIIQKELKLLPQDVALVGDQLFGDIMTGNWLETHTILTRQCDAYYHDEQQIGFFKRANNYILEKFVNK